MTITRGGIAQLDKSKPRNRCRKWMLSCRVDGVRKMKRFAGSYRDAQAALDEWRGELAKSIDDGETFGGYARKWHEWREASGELAPGTLVNDRRALKAIERMNLADVPLADLTAEQLRDGLAWFKAHPAREGAAPLSGATMNKLHVTLAGILAQAVDDGKVAASPMRKMKPPKVDTPEKRALAPDELMRVLDVLEAMEPNGRVVACHLMASLGLRRGEALGAFVSDIDGPLFRVRHAVKSASMVIAEPKSAAGVRALPMPERTRTMLARWLQARTVAGIGDAPVLCCDWQGQPYTASQFNHWWQRHAHEFGCDSLTPHQLRHSNLSMMARHLPSAFDLQRWAGWSSIAPARIYIHEDADALAVAVGSAFGYSPDTSSGLRLIP